MCPREAKVLREMEKPFLHLAQGPPCPLPRKPMRQQQGLWQDQLTPQEEGKDGAGQKDSWFFLCIRSRLGIKDVPWAMRRLTGDHGDPEGQPLPETVFVVATAAGTIAALGLLRGPQL